MKEQKYYDVTIDITRTGDFHILASSKEEAERIATEKAKNGEMPSGHYPLSWNVYETSVSEFQEA